MHWQKGIVKEAAGGQQYKILFDDREDPEAIETDLLPNEHGCKRTWVVWEDIYGSSTEEHAKLKLEDLDPAGRFEVVQQRPADEEFDGSGRWRGKKGRAWKQDWVAWNFGAPHDWRLAKVTKKMAGVGGKLELKVFNDPLDVRRRPTTKRNAQLFKHQHGTRAKWIRLREIEKEAALFDVTDEEGNNTRCQMCGGNFHTQHRRSWCPPCRRKHK